MLLFIINIIVNKIYTILLLIINDTNKKETMKVNYINLFNSKFTHKYTFNKSKILKSLNYYDKLDLFISDAKYNKMDSFLDFKVYKGINFVVKFNKKVIEIIK
jgi:hypothetical protein